MWGLLKLAAAAIFFLFTFSVFAYYGIAGGQMMIDSYRSRNHIVPPIVLTFSSDLTVGAVGTLAPPIAVPPPLPANKGALHEGWNQAD